MGVTVAVTRTAADTGGGNQNITTTDLGGLTPKAVWFIVSEATTDGTPASHAVLGVGAATATDERWAMCVRAENGQGTTDTGRRGTTDECIMVLNTADNDVEAEADFSTFIANGATINWGNTPGSAYLLTAVFFAGTDVSALAGSFSMDDTEDNTVDVNTVGFEPDVLLTAMHGTALNDTGTGTAFFGHGVVTNDGSVYQACYGYRSASGAADSAVSARMTESYGIGQAESDGSWAWAGEFGSFDAGGFSCTTRLGDASSDDVGFLALAFNGAVDWEADVISTPTSTGNDGVTDPGFRPQYVHVGVTQMPAIDTAYTDGNAGSFGISTFDSDDEYCTSYQDEDGQGTSDTQSLSDDTAVNLPNDDGSAAHVASFVSFDVSGWTWNFSATEGTAVQCWYLAIEGGAMPVLAMMHQRRLREQG